MVIAELPHPGPPPSSDLCVWPSLAHAGAAGRRVIWSCTGHRAEAPCRTHEATRDAAARELREELGREATVGRLLWLIENLFQHDGVTVHELGFISGAHLPAGDPLIGAQGDFPGADGEASIFFRWVPRADLTSLAIYPHVLRTLAPVLPAVAEHIVVDERRSLYVFPETAPATLCAGKVLYQWLGLAWRGGRRSRTAIRGT